MPKPPSDLNNTQVMPNPVLEKRTRRQFSADFKLRIIAEADACKHGEPGGLLRREKLYSN
jgi:transposase